MAMTYNNLTVPAGGYYIFANTGTVTVAGISKTADAIYSASNAGYPDLIYTSGGSCGSGSPDADSLGIAYSGGGAWIDRIGWTVNAHAPALYEGNARYQILPCCKMESNLYERPAPAELSSVLDAPMIQEITTSILSARARPYIPHATLEI